MITTKNTRFVGQNAAFKNAVRMVIQKNRAKKIQRKITHIRKDQKDTLQFLKAIAIPLDAQEKLDFACKFLRHSNELRLSESKKKIVELLEQTDLFVYLTKVFKDDVQNLKEILVAKMKIMEVSAGQTLYYQNDQCQYIGLLLQGQVNQFKLKSVEQMFLSREDAQTIYTKTILENIRQEQLKKSFLQRLTNKGPSLDQNKIQNLCKRRVASSQYHTTQFGKTAQELFNSLHSANAQQKIQEDIKKRTSQQFSFYMERKKTEYDLILGGNDGVEKEAMKEKQRLMSTDEDVILKRTCNDLGQIDVFDVKELNKYFDHDGCIKYSFDKTLFSGSTVGGELMSLQENRQYTVMAKKPSQIVFFSKNVFRKFIHDTQKKEMYKKHNFIHRVFFQSSITDSQVKQFLFMFKKEKYIYGNLIYSQKSKIEQIYIIFKGQVEITCKKSVSGNQQASIQRQAILGSEQMLCVSEYLSGVTVMDTSARCLSGKVVVFSVSIADLENIFAQRSHISYYLEKKTSAQQVYRAQHNDYCQQKLKEFSDNQVQLAKIVRPSIQRQQVQTVIQAPMNVRTQSSCNILDELDNTYTVYTQENLPKPAVAPVLPSLKMVDRLQSQYQKDIMNQTNTLTHNEQIMSKYFKVSSREENKQEFYTSMRKMNANNEEREKLDERRLQAQLKRSNSHGNYPRNISNIKNLSGYDIVKKTLDRQMDKNTIDLSLVQRGDTNQSNLFSTIAANTITQLEPSLPGTGNNHLSSYDIIQCQDDYMARHSPQRNRNLSNAQKSSLPKHPQRSNPQHQFQKSKYFLSLKEQSEKHTLRNNTPLFRFKTKQYTHIQ